MSILGETRQQTASSLGASSPYRQSIPPSVLARSRVEAGEEVTLALQPNDGQPRLACRPADGAGEYAVTRTLSARRGESVPGLTLPKQCIETGGFTGAYAVAYTEPASDLLFVGLARDSSLQDVSLSAIERAYVSEQRQGVLAVSLSADLAGPLTAASSLWFWFDHYGGQLFFVLDAVERAAPDGALELTANPNTGRAETAGLSFFFPKTVGRLCGLAGTTLRWGRTDSGNRLLGVATTVSE